MGIDPSLLSGVLANPSDDSASQDNVFPVEPDTTDTLPPLGGGTSSSPDFSTMSGQSSFVPTPVSAPAPDLSWLTNQMSPDFTAGVVRPPIAQSAAPATDPYWNAQPASPDQPSSGEDSYFAPKVQPQPAPQEQPNGWWSGLTGAKGPLSGLGQWWQNTADPAIQDFNTSLFGGDRVTPGAAEMVNDRSPQPGPDTVVHDPGLFGNISNWLKSEVGQVTTPIDNAANKAIDQSITDPHVNWMAKQLAALALPMSQGNDQQRQDFDRYWTNLGDALIDSGAIRADYRGLAHNIFGDNGVADAAAEVLTQGTVAIPKFIWGIPQFVVDARNDPVQAVAGVVQTADRLATNLGRAIGGDPTYNVDDFGQTLQDGIQLVLLKKAMAEGGGETGIFKGSDLSLPKRAVNAVGEMSGVTSGYAPELAPFGRGPLAALRRGSVEQNEQQNRENPAQSTDAAASAGGEAAPPAAQQTYGALSPEESMRLDDLQRQLDWLDQHRGLKDPTAQPLLAEANRLLEKAKGGQEQLPLEPTFQPGDNIRENPVLPAEAAAGGETRPAGVTTEAIAPAAARPAGDATAAAAPLNARAAAARAAERTAPTDAGQATLFPDGRPEAALPHAPADVAGAAARAAEADAQAADAYGRSDAAAPAGTTTEARPDAHAPAPGTGNGAATERGAAAVGVAPEAGAPGRPGAADNAERVLAPHEQLAEIDRHIANLTAEMKTRRGMATTMSGGHPQDIAKAQAGVGRKYGAAIADLKRQRAELLTKVNQPGVLNRSDLMSPIIGRPIEAGAVAPEVVPYLSRPEGRSMQVATTKGNVTVYGIQDHHDTALLHRVISKAIDNDLIGGNPHDFGNTGVTEIHIRPGNRAFGTWASENPQVIHLNYDIHTPERIRSFADSYAKSLRDTLHNPPEEVRAIPGWQDRLMVGMRVLQHIGNLRPEDALYETLAHEAIHAFVGRLTGAWHVADDGQLAVNLIHYLDPRVLEDAEAAGLDGQVEVLRQWYDFVQEHGASADMSEWPAERINQVSQAQADLQEYIGYTVQQILGTVPHRYNLANDTTYSISFWYPERQDASAASTKDWAFRESASPSVADSSAARPPASPAISTPGRAPPGVAARAADRSGSSNPADQASLSPTEALQERLKALHKQDATSVGDVIRDLADGKVAGEKALKEPKGVAGTRPWREYWSKVADLAEQRLNPDTTPESERPVVPDTGSLEKNARQVNDLLEAIPEERLDKIENKMEREKGAPKTPGLDGEPFREGDPQWMAYYNEVLRRALAEMKNSDDFMQGADPIYGGAKAKAPNAKVKRVDQFGTPESQIVADDRARILSPVGEAPVEPQEAPGAAEAPPTADASQSRLDEKAPFVVGDRVRVTVPPGHGMVGPRSTGRSTKGGTFSGAVHKVEPNAIIVKGDNGKFYNVDQRFAAERIEREAPGAPPAATTTPPTDFPPQQVKALSAASDYNQYHRLQLELAKNPPPGTVIWRGEKGEPGEINGRGSMGMHWTVRPDMALPGKVIWQGVLENPADQIIPRSDLIWTGKSQSMDSEAEVRLQSNKNIRIQGAWVWDGPEGSHPVPGYLTPLRPGEDPNWKWVPIDKSFSVAHLPTEDIINYPGITQRAPVAPAKHGDFTLKFHPADADVPRNRILATDASGKHAAELAWHPDLHEITNLNVVEPHRRQGLATAMWRMAQEADPLVSHSADRTDAGDAWARATGDVIPQRKRGGAADGNHDAAAAELARREADFRADQEEMGRQPGSIEMPPAPNEDLGPAFGEKIREAIDEIDHPDYTQTKDSWGAEEKTAYEQASKILDDLAKRDIDVGDAQSALDEWRDLKFKKSDYEGSMEDAKDEFHSAKEELWEEFKSVVEDLEEPQREPDDGEQEPLPIEPTQEFAAPTESEVTAPQIEPQPAEPRPFLYDSEKLDKVTAKTAPDPAVFKRTSDAMRKVNGRANKSQPVDPRDAMKEAGYTPERIEYLRKAANDMVDEEALKEWSSMSPGFRRMIQGRFGDVVAEEKAKDPQVLVTGVPFDEIAEPEASAPVEVHPEHAEAVAARDIPENAQALVDAQDTEALRDSAEATQLKKPAKPREQFTQGELFPLTREQLKAGIDAANKTAKKADRDEAAFEQSGNDYFGFKDLGPVNTKVKPADVIKDLRELTGRDSSGADGGRKGPPNDRTRDAGDPVFDDGYKATASVGHDLPVLGNVVDNMHQVLDHLNQIINYRGSIDPRRILKDIVYYVNAHRRMSIAVGKAMEKGLKQVAARDGYDYARMNEDIIDYTELEGEEANTRLAEIRQKSPEAAAFAEYLKQHDLANGKILRDRGAIWKVIENFFPRIVKGTPVGLENYIEKVRDAQLSPNSRHFIGRKGTWATIREMKQAGFDVETDIAKAWTQHSLSSGRAARVREMIGKMERYQIVDSTRKYAGPGIVRRLSDVPAEMRSQFEPIDYGAGKSALQWSEPMRNPDKSYVKNSEGKVVYDRGQYYVWKPLKEHFQRLAKMEDGLHGIEHVATWANAWNGIFKAYKFIINPTHLFNMGSNIFTLGGHDMRGIWRDGDRLLKGADVHETGAALDTATAAEFRQALEDGFTPPDATFRDADIGGGIHQILERTPVLSHWHRFMWQEVAYKMGLGLYSRLRAKYLKKAMAKYGVDSIDKLDPQLVRELGQVAAEHAKSAVGFMDNLDMSRDYRLWGNFLTFALKWSTIQARTIGHALDYAPLNRLGADKMANLGGGESFRSADPFVRQTERRMYQRLLFGGLLRAGIAATVMGAISSYFTGQQSTPWQNFQRDPTHTFDMYKGRDATGTDQWIHNPFFGFQTELATYAATAIKAASEGQDPFHVATRTAARIAGKANPVTMTAFSAALGRDISAWMNNLPGNYSDLDTNKNIAAIRQSLDAMGLPDWGSLEDRLIYAFRQLAPDPGFAPSLSQPTSNPLELSQALGAGQWLNPAAVGSMLLGYRISKGERWITDPQTGQQITLNQYMERKNAQTEANQAVFGQMSKAFASGDMATVQRLRQQLGLTASQATQAILFGQTQKSGGAGLAFQGMDPNATSTPSSGEREDTLAGHKLTPQQTSQLEAQRFARQRAVYQSLANDPTYKTGNASARAKMINDYLKLADKITNEQMATAFGLKPGAAISDGTADRIFSQTLAVRAQVASNLRREGILTGDPMRDGATAQRYQNMADSAVWDSYFGKNKGATNAQLVTHVTTQAAVDENTIRYVSSLPAFRQADPYTQTQMQNQALTLANRITNDALSGKSERYAGRALSVNEVFGTVRNTIALQQSALDMLHQSGWYQSLDPKTQSAMDTRYTDLAARVAMTDTHYNSAGGNQGFAKALQARLVADEGYHQLVSQYIPGGQSQLTAYDTELADMKRQFAEQNQVPPSKIGHYDTIITNWYKQQHPDYADFLKARTTWEARAPIGILYSALSKNEMSVAANNPLNDFAPSLD